MAAPRRARPAAQASAPIVLTSPSREYTQNGLVDSLRGLVALASQTENCARVSLISSIELDSQIIRIAAVRGVSVDDSSPFIPAETRALDLARKTCEATTTRSLATAPITVAGICVGAVCLTAAAPAAGAVATASFAARAQAVAAQAAALFELQHARGTESANKDVFLRMDSDEAIRRFNDQLKGVNDVSAALNGAADLSAVLPATLVSVLDILDADGAVLWRYDAAHDEVSVVTRAGIAPTDTRSLDRTVGADKQSAVGRAVSSTENVIVNDIVASDLPAPVKAIWKLLGVTQLVALPLMDRGRVVGALELVSRRKRLFSSTDLETMRLVRGQLALAFGRAILFGEIHDQKSTLEQVLAGTADGVYVTGADAKFSLWNVAAARIAGAPADEVLAQGYGALSGADRRGRSLEELDRNAFDAAKTDSGSRQTVQNYEVFFAKTSRWVAVSASPLRDASGAVTAMVHAFRDITAARELEQLKADFISTVSHELRTPLTSIKGATALLFEQVPADSGNAFELLQMVRNNSERLLRLINDLLDASKIEAGKLTIRKQPCDPERLLERAVDGMTGYAEEYGVTVTTDFARGLAPVVVDPDRVEQIMSNLLSNAIKYSHRGDSVSVRARSEGAYLRVDIIDTGVGIPSSALPRLFEKFSQVDRGGRNRPGTGLGLVISKGLIEAHGGSISVSSTEGEGTTFTFTLPCAKRGADRT
ncbi:MAG TPA: ATP-binding protein [Candidatus Eremiobacteraceae bacterium]